MADDTRAMLVETADRLFADLASPSAVRAAEDDGLDPALWAALEAAGFARALPASRGGAALDLADALSLLIPAGRHALPAPFAETIIAHRLLLAAGLDPPDGPLTVAVSDDLSIHHGRATGRAARVPWARDCAHVVLVGPGDRAALVATTDAAITPGRNIAGEPRDDLAFVDAPAILTHAPDGRVALRALGAVARAAQMAGAIEAALALSVAYAQGRVQFGRPIGGFQAIQHALAVFAGHAAAATAAAQAAIEAAHDPSALAIAAAKIRVGEAAGACAAIAHQVHGAMGFTQDYALQRLTRRLWSWREEYGAEAAWSRELGAAAAAQGADGLWAMITAA